MKHASIQSSIYKNKSKRHKQKIRNCLLGIQFFICWLFIVFTVALYLQANKTGSTLFNTLTEKELIDLVVTPGEVLPSALSAKDIRALFD